MPKHSTARDPLAEFDELPDCAFVRRPIVKAICGQSDDSWDRLVKAGRAPAPVRIADRSIAWRVGELRTWLARPESYFTGELPSYNPEKDAP
ncbi:MAG: helix-turn-helix transcriptional regulator [Rhizobacter sp.]